MKRRGVLIVAVVAAAAAVVAAFAGTGSADHPGSTTLTFVERFNQGTFRFIDNRPKAPGRSQSVSLGDTFLGTTPLYNAANTRRVGRYFFKCTAVRGARRFQRSVFQCEGTATLSNGTLVTSGIVRGGRTDPGAVIGGTGAYEGASGSYNSDERRRTAVDTVHFDTD
jgi:hypothetical protein